MKTNTNLMTYFLSRALFLGGGMSTLFLLGGKDAYISAILGTLIGIAILFIINKVSKSVKVPLKEYLKNKSFINILFKIVYFLYIIVIVFVLLIILSTFLYSYFLPFTPSIISCLPLIFLAAFKNSKNIKNIYYVALALLAISLFIITLKTLLLTNEFELSNLTTILSTNTKDIFKAALVYATLSTAPYLLIFDENVSFKESVKFYLLACIVNIIVMITIIGVLGEMVKVYSYPEYAVLRKIRFLDFIENIENFISISWFFDIFITISLAGLKTKDTLNINNSFVPFFVTLLILFVVYFTISDSFYNSMIIYKVFPFVLAFLMFILLVLIFVKMHTRKNQHQ